MTVHVAVSTGELLFGVAVALPIVVLWIVVELLRRRERRHFDGSAIPRLMVTLTANTDEMDKQIAEMQRRLADFARRYR